MYPEKGRSTHASATSQQEPTLVAVKESLGMFGITRVESEPFTSGGKVATTTRFFHGTAALASREKTDDAVELPSRSSVFVTREGAVVDAKSAFKGSAVIAANSTRRPFTEKRGTSGSKIDERKIRKWCAEIGGHCAH